MHRLSTYIPSVVILALVLGQASVASATSTVSVSQVTGTGTFPTVSDTETWPSDPAGWTFARSYTSGGNTYMVLLRQHTGDLDIYNLSAGAIGSLAYSYNLRSWWTSAEIISPGGVPTLVLHDAEKGAIRTYVLNSTGSLGARSDTVHTAWKDKNLFTTYLRGSTWYFYGVNTRTGSTTLYTSGGAAVATNTLSAGWTAVDFVKLGTNTYRVFYKGGDFPGNEGGRLVIDRIDANGNSDLLVHSEAALESREGWTSVKFYTAGANTYLMLYGGSTSTPSNLRLEQFNGSGLTGITESPLASGWTDFEPYTIGGSTYMLALNEEGVERINGSEIDNIVQGVQSQIDANMYGGYQFTIAQSGRVLYEHVFGWQDVANAVPMTVDAPMSFASLSKMFTTMSVLKLADMGEIDLDTPVPNYLDYDADPGTYSGFTVHSLFSGITPRDLLLHTTGAGSYTGSCGAPDLASSVDLTGCLGNPTSSVCTATNPATGGLLCPRSYHNANSDISRGLVEYLSLTEGTIDFVAYVQDLWMERLGMAGVDCMTPAGSQMVLYGCAVPCAGTPQWDSANCGSGGWKASGRQTLRYARGVRYEHVLGPELTADLMSRTTLDGNGNVTHMGWDTPSLADDTTSPEMFLCKNGGSGGADTVLCMGSKSVDLYFATNHDAGATGTWLVGRYNLGN